MIPILYKTVSEGTVPSNYGVGALTDAISATVTEERNGAYELALTYPANGIHAEDIEPNAFIKAKPNFMDDPQLFRIIKVSATIAGKFTVQAQHISYDLSGKIITAGTAGSCTAACALLQTKAGNFAITTDRVKAGAFSIAEPSSVRSWFGGKAGSLLDIYGGEWKYDNYGARLMTSRGADRGVTIRYGKNLTQLSQVLDMSNLCTGIVPFYIDQNGNKTVGARVPTGLTLDTDRDLAVDFSQQVQPEDSTPIMTQLANLAAAYISGNEFTTIGKSITLDFVQTGAITERVDLCDTVSIYFEPLGISAKAKCVKTVWDVLEGRYTKTTFGSARPNIADTIAQNKKELETTASRADVNRATELITGNRGGYLILHDSDGDDLPDEFLIMNTPDIHTATKVWRWNQAGLGYSDTGYAGPYGLAMTKEGEINADFLKVGVIQDRQGNSQIDMTNGTASLWTLSAKGSFRIKNGSSGKTLGIYFPYDAGGAFQLNNANEEGRANLFVNAAGSYLYLYEPDGTLLANLSTSNSGAGLVLNNTSGTKNIDIHSETNSGVISIENAAGKSVVHGWGNPGGWFQVRDGLGNTTIELNGNNGGIICVSVTQTSSRKVKKNITELPEEEAEAILKLQAVRFDYKNEDQGKDKRGFIAEDVAEIIPGLVTPETENTPAALDYIGMVPYIQTVLKAQERRLQEQEERIQELEKKIKDITGG